MVYLIGGACRVGKSTLAELLLARKRISVLATDTLVHTLNEVAPQLGVTDKGTLAAKAGRLFPFVEGFIRHNFYSVGEFCVEGDLILPEHVRRLREEFPVRACFLGMSRTSVDMLLRFPGPNGWTNKISPERLERLPGEIVERSALFEKECRKWQLPYFDMAGDHTRRLEAAYRCLTGEPAPVPEKRGLTRRQHAQALAAGLVQAAAAAPAGVKNSDVAYGASTIPAGIRSRFLDDINGLRVHVLEAGIERPDRPCVLLLHGFPELAYSWRKVMLPLAAEGYHVVAPDQRGYGRTTGWDSSYDANLASFSLLNMVRDCLTLVAALGYKSVKLVGHDMGSPVSAWCALVRPDVFRSVTLMSAPFAGPPELPRKPAAPTDIDAQLAALARPRKHYQTYYTTREADNNLRHCPQGLHAFFRAYYHYKSADWKGNKPFPLQARTAEEFARLPAYYVMDRDKGMAETVAAEMPSPAEIAACKWLTEDELDVYASEYGRTGFQGGLQGYRRSRDAALIAELQTFAGRTIDVPSCFIAGRSDWGVYQTPGAVERMRSAACTQMRGFHLVDGAGHWVQQEQPEAVCRLLIPFLREAG